MHIYYSWLQLVTVGYNWLQLGTVGYSWVQLVTIGYSWVQLGTVGYSWVQLYKCSSVVPTKPTTPTIHLPKTLALAKYNWFNQELAFIKLFLVNLLSSLTSLFFTFGVNHLSGDMTIGKLDLH